MNRFFCFAILLCFSTLNYAQVLEQKIEGIQESKNLIEILTTLEKKNDAKFFFLSEWLTSFNINQSYNGLTLAAVLTDLFTGTELSYFEMYPNVIIILNDPTDRINYKRSIENAQRANFNLTKFSFGSPTSIPNTKVFITGVVRDLKNSEPLHGVNISVNQTAYGTTTDTDGRYELSLPPGLVTLTFSYLDFESSVIDLSAYESGEINLDMNKTSTLLDEVVVTGGTIGDVAAGRIGQIQLNVREIKRSPAFMGEADPIKQIQTLPGVSTVSEAAAGFNVRGGSADQNLVLFDDLPVFNSSHALGFLSAFNAESIRELTFHRGGISSEYGGRVSSVLDIKSKDGSFDRWNGNAGIGLLAANLALNGPVTADKTSVAMSLRSTYSNWLINSIRTEYADLRKSSVNFYDANIKVSHKFNSNTKLSISGYSSDDSFRLTGDTTYRWNNLQGAAKLNHQFSPTVAAEFVVGASSYNYKVGDSNILTASELGYRITTFVLKANFDIQYGGHNLQAGWHLSYDHLKPGYLTPKSTQSSARQLSLTDQHAIENAFYLSEDFKLSSKIQLEAGVRIPVFVSFGPGKVYTYDSENILTDTLFYGSWQPIKAYVGIEPRLSAKYSLSETSSIKVGYNRINQFLHLITNTAAITPIDIWQPSGYHLKPQRADQISAGIFKDTQNKKYSAFAEVYYKNIVNIVDFKDGAKLILNPTLEQDLLQGRGYAYGIETFVSKNTGRLTYSLNYTYSRSFRLITGPTKSESINQGEKYPSNFDQPHILNYSWKYSLSSRHFFTGTFTYHTGRPVTVPIAAFEYENTTIAYFSSRNQYRIPDYHRLDLAFVMEGNHKRRQSWKGTWVISAYNVYSRKNPYTVFFKGTANGIPEPYQLAIIGTILPSISYNIKL